MKIVAWILVIWIVVSIVNGIKKEGLDMNPFIKQYQIMLEEHRVLTIVVSIIVVIALLKILF